MRLFLIEFSLKEILFLDFSPFRFFGSFTSLMLRCCFCAMCYELFFASCKWHEQPEPSVVELDQFSLYICPILHVHIDINLCFFFFPR